MMEVMVTQSLMLGIAKFAFAKSATFAQVCYIFRKLEKYNTMP